MDTSASHSPHAPGHHTQPRLVPELNLIPFPQGRYLVSIARLDHPPREIVGVQFPNVLAASLPSPGSATVDGKPSAWLVGTGNPVTVEVNSPGAVVAFITLRPSDFATSGVHVNVVKLGPAQVHEQPIQAPGPFAANAQGHSGGHFAPGQGRPSASASERQAPARPQTSPFDPGVAPPMAAWAGNLAPGAPQQPAEPEPRSTARLPQAKPFVSPYAQQGFRPAFDAAYGAGSPPLRPTGGFQTPRNAPLVQACGHIQERGDLLAETGKAVGSPLSRLRLEAVAFKPEGLPAGDLEYATVAHDGAMSPWTSFPYFSGSKGMGLPLSGFVARLGGESAERYDVVYSGTFIQAGQTADCMNGQFLHSNIRGDALESLWLRIVPKG
ncbi:hypothetical protein NNJEOMEG_00058 [Fundidesulfovibrio magnetotacticus]|uniref:Uncharacterized protein n=2 Tax=Fundidesulfovibrio magnetotacticus TaxID=2730080 RepID=A0A6V8LR50_9BACT|nr:hypothetical protein NNJEOMEG_00058 [Fundidesulfovibrio magnetotacticus]